MFANFAWNETPIKGICKPALPKLSYTLNLQVIGNHGNTYYVLPAELLLNVCIYCSYQNVISVSRKLSRATIPS